MVTAETPLVDLDELGPTVAYGSEFLKNLPTSRNFYDIMAVSPDVSLAAVDEDRLVAGGSNVQSNSWFIDGIETKAPETGTAWIYVNPDAIQEVQIMHIGAPAEYGNMLGAALNVVTKSGSNEFNGGVNLYWFDDSLVDSSIDFDSEFPEYHMDEFTDATGVLGGPFIEDRLWFFGSYEYYRQNQTFPGADPSDSPTQYADRFSLKMTAQLNGREPDRGQGLLRRLGLPAAANPYAPVGPGGREGNRQRGGSTTSRSSPTAPSSTRGTRDSRSRTPTCRRPAAPRPPTSTTRHREAGQPSTLAATGIPGPTTPPRPGDASVSHFADDFIAGDHDFKLGSRRARATPPRSRRCRRPAPTTHYAYDYYGTTYDYFYKVEGLPYFYGQEQESVSGFIDDSWKLTDRVTLNLGLRYDHHKGVIPSFPRLDMNGDPTGETIPGIDPVLTWDHVSPRLGFAYAAGAEQKTVIRGSFSVYYDGNVSGNWNYPPPGSEPGRVPGPVMGGPV